MTTYKVISTITWHFDSEDQHNVCLENAKLQLENILNCKPKGDVYNGFSVQVDIARMKDRKRMIHIGCFEFDDVFPFVTVEETKKEYKVGDKIYCVRMNSDRYHVFKNNICCVACGLSGSKMILDINSGDLCPHFNMYAEEDGRLVLMTKDHKLAKSKGGTDKLDNYRTMCSTCNNIRGNSELTLEQIKYLRNLFVNNPDKLPRKELRELINNTRNELEKGNSFPPQ